MGADLSLMDEAEQYMKWDPNEETKAEIFSYGGETEDFSEIKKRFGSRLAFGTAGLRGAMGAGYTKMNDLVILQTTQGISKYLTDQLGPAAKEKGVVIGYDHRKLGSLSSLGFARMSAAVLLSQGYKVYLLEGFVPTPFVAFGVSHLNCAAGFMVTASHNPKGDNGFKVYWGNGAQIISPHDIGITEAILSNLEPWEAKYDVANVLQHANALDVTEKISTAYYSAISRLITDKDQNTKSSLRVVYTAMHGVGAQWVKQAFEIFGHAPFIPVISQNDPDPDFPTVTFPNPEEEGALIEAITTATQCTANIIIANDPDADRLAVAEYIPSQDEHSVGRWHVFTGNELGILLGYWQIKKWKESSLNVSSENSIEANKEKASLFFSLVITHSCVNALEPLPPHFTTLYLPFHYTFRPITLHFFTSILYSLRYTYAFTSLHSMYLLKRVAVLASVVSSKMLRAIALAEGVEYYETLTGFKWIGNKALALKEDNVCVLFSFEEALGYCVGDIVADKDGVCAAAVFVEMAGELLGMGCTVFSQLQNLQLQYGQYISYNSYFISNITTVTNSIFERLRTGGPNGNYFDSCGGVKITSIKDVTLGYDSTSPDGSSDLPMTKDSHMIMYKFENGCSVTLRTSGTEPKIKFYTEIAGDPLKMESKYDLEKRLKIFVDRLINEMLQPDVNDLARA